ncbi:MAG: phage protein [Verrucomicrobiales bacterium]|nr:phage protein [Verrucomicrobiales bacterium]
MSLLLIKEDGTGLPNANAYANAADGDAYHDGHLYATSWTSASLANKEKALVFATRVIDSQYRFHGFRTTTTQALQWPRTSCPDQDSAPDSTGVAYFASNHLPSSLTNATCEMARALLATDRTGAPPGEGLDATQTSASSSSKDGTTSSSVSNSSMTRYSKVDTRPTISQAAQAFLSMLGNLRGQGSGPVPLLRV